MNLDTTLLRKSAALLISAVAATAYVQSAQAGVAGTWTRSSTVTDTVTNNNNGTWTYNYTVNNTSQLGFNQQGSNTQPVLVDWELPWFGDAVITNILSPTRWNSRIETIGTANLATGWGGVAAWQTPGDPFYAGANSPFTTATQVLHWFNTCWAANGDAVGCEGTLDSAIFPGGSLNGFAFTASYDSTSAPYQASWAELPVRTGDPAFPLGGIPNSPLAQGTAAVPEPSLLGLLGLGLMGVILGRRRRRA